MSAMTSGQQAAPLGQGGPKRQDDHIQQQDATTPSQPSWPAIASGEQAYLSAGYGYRTHADTAPSQDGILDYGQAAQVTLKPYTCWRASLKLLPMSILSLQVNKCSDTGLMDNVMAPLEAEIQQVDCKGIKK